MLPIRQLAHEPNHAVASLIGNQASLAVVEALGKIDVFESFPAPLH